jgi:NADPH:quinone reductase-like Zn-dependent oxidoreductase
VRRLGADVAVDAKREDIAEQGRYFSPDGVDAVLALSGGDALERCLDAIWSGGRLAYPNGIEPEPKKRRGLHVTSYDAVTGVRQFEALNLGVKQETLKFR